MVSWNLATQLIISVSDFWFMRDFNGLQIRVVRKLLSIQVYCGK